MAKLSSTMTIKAANNREHAMPLRKITPKPSTEEKKLATELQAPPKRNRRTIETSEPAPPKFRTLADAGIDGARKTFIKKEEMFSSDEADVSIPFIMTGARLMPNTFQPGSFQVVFSIQIEGEEKGSLEDHLISMPQDDSRMEYVGYFATNTVPLAWLELHKIERYDKGGKRLNDYYAIHQVPSDDIPF